jgi:hypothetical protein
MHATGPSRPPPRPPRNCAPVWALVLGLALVLLAPAADAQWRWRDANGRINASDRPPPREVPDKDILSRPNTQQVRRVVDPSTAASAASAPAPAAPVAGASAPPTPLQAEVEARKKRAEQEQAARARAEEERLAQQRAENCRRARGHLTALESGQRIARTNERGEREVLDDRGRAEEVRATRVVIASDCR